MNHTFSHPPAVTLNLLVSSYITLKKSLERRPKNLKGKWTRFVGYTIEEFLA